MQKTKKIIAIFLSMIMVLSTLGLSGCGKNNSEKTGEGNTNTSSAKATSTPVDGEASNTEIPADVIPKQTVTLDVYSQLANYSGDQIGWFAKVLLDKFNVKLNIVKDEDGAFTTRMESGNLGDIVIFGDDSTDYITAVENGMLFDWNQDDLLTDYGPYIKANMKKALERNSGITKTGKVYGLGNDVASSSKDHMTYFIHPDIRWDLYKKIGYPKIGTLEDLVGVLAQMKKICPTSDSGKKTYGLSIFADWDGNMEMFVKSMGALYGYDEIGVGLYDNNTQTWQGCLDDGSLYLRYLKFFNALYRNNLLDPDSMTQGYEGASEDYINGGAFWNIFSFLGSSAYNTKAHLDQGKAMYTLAIGDQNTVGNGLSLYGGNRVITIGSTTQYPELCMAILNWLSTPEGYMITNYGPKDVCWFYDENGKTQLTKLGLACKNNGKTDMSAGGYSGSWDNGINQMSFSLWNLDSNNPDSNGETYNYQNWEGFQSTLNTDIQKDWRSYTGFVTPDEYLDSKKHTITTATSFSEDTKSDELDVTWQQVTKAITDYSWKAIYAKSEKQYNFFVKEMQKKAIGYGYAKCCEFSQKQANKRKEFENKARAK